jgi:hypothetical protein
MSWTDMPSKMKPTAKKNEIYEFMCEFRNSLRSTNNSVELWSSYLFTYQRFLLYTIQASYHDIKYWKLEIASF